MSVVILILISTFQLVKNIMRGFGLPLDMLGVTELFLTSGVNVVLSNFGVISVVSKGGRG